MNILNRKGQNTAEYAILIALVIAAAVAMQTYVKRSVQGGVKYTVDKLRSSETASGQYEPYYLESKYTNTEGAYQNTEETQEGGKVIRTFAGAGGAEGSSKSTTREGYQKTKGVDTQTAATP